jgi:putative ABC transport system substrate-binding protein
VPSAGFTRIFLARYHATVATLHAVGARGPLLNQSIGGALLMIRRRDFIAGLGAATWPLAAWAQPPAMPVLGFLNLGPPNDLGPAIATRSSGAGGLGGSYMTAFRQGLAEAGLVDGRTLEIDYRWANNEGRLLAPLAAELVQRPVAVIVALDSGPAVLAAKAATSTIPIVFALGADPVKLGLVASLSRPGGNMTGVTFLSAELTGKRLDLLREIAPAARTVAYFTDPGAPDSEEAKREMLETARALGRQAIILEARTELDVDAAFAALVERRAGALVVGPHILFERNARKIVELAARYRIPAIYPGRRFAVLGGLMSYTADLAAAVRQVGSFYVAQILRGAKPANLPVQQPTKFDLAINRTTAKTLGLTVPRVLLAMADEVIDD